MKYLVKSRIETSPSPGRPSGIFLEGDYIELSEQDAAPLLEAGEIKGVRPQ